MFEDTLELAENKLLLLYIFNKVQIPITNNQVTQIILENNFINYFTLQQYLSELVSSNFLKYTEDENKHRLEITEKGKKVLVLFSNRISNNKINVLDEYLNKEINNIKREVTITSDYTIEHKDKFIVNLRAVENDITLLDLKITVDSNKQARDLCSKWKNNSSEIYSKILNLLIN
ncbi:putative transcriptional regulator [Clostridium tetanomorphum]|uniref:DUF4364 family protein n=1 Tax=Clostridium tetanomorphum TaxID=1553 RepID=A0A923EAQ5_CLOTT|nr:DUF4364 family protein [Clostridium tetanomorphum]KAJ50452.1 hypothetical protein CTM_17591 [Clostridium tetanomorphum DSM 665]MBC2398241.1 DUF4364 family protein [Clostridium tetanomorphum]MBP1865640.1 putative transcriptional regulator [Clostridium tetanomorphum]NRS85854.1 putative transcriptional regulator [Clostridium tetanomorphum]NRZ96138.1 putative transcriptional regulator [Clostridium tetanomorphum]